MLLLLVCPSDLLGLPGEDSSEVKLLGLDSEREEGRPKERMPRKKLPQQGEAKAKQLK